MKRKATIQANGKKGVIHYADDVRPVPFSVDHPDQEIVKKVTDYFQTRREFNIPESNKIDDYRVYTAMPTDTPTYFELSLCTLHIKTGIDLLKTE